jgi:hypothetical protein
MGPKKDAKKPAPGAEGVEGEDPLVLLKNYQSFCKLIGVPQNGKMAKICNDEEHYPVTQLIFDDEFGPLGPGGTRAVMSSIMGKHFTCLFFSLHVCLFVCVCVCIIL